MTWLTAFTAWPAPIGPTWVMVRPIAVRTGRARSTSAASPPTKIVNVAFLAPSLPPGDRGVDHREPALLEPRGEVPAARWRDRRTVDDQGARAGALGDAVRPEEDGLDVGRIGHADDRDVDIGDGPGRSVGHDRTEVRQLGRPARGAVPGRHVEPRAGQVGSHRCSHRAEPEESDASRARAAVVGGHRRSDGQGGTDRPRGATAGAHPRLRPDPKRSRPNRPPAVRPAMRGLRPRQRIARARR